jgi:hemerythrin-like domain-containing protein
MKITEGLKAEHKNILDLFQQIEQGLPGLQTVREVRLVAGLVEGVLQRHAARESELAYSALDHALAQSGEVKTLFQEHHELDRRLRETIGARTCKQARELLMAALDASRQHFRMEEEHVFPLCERTLKPETLERLGRPLFERGPTKRPES